MSSENRIVLKAWFGETPDGQVLEKPSFQIFVEGEVVEQRRQGRKTELIGFVAKEPGLPINFLPVVDAFRDLIPHFEVQIRTALLEWRSAQKAAAEAKLAELQQSVDAASDDLTKQFAEDALQAAQSMLQSAEQAHQIELSVKRTGNAPDEEAIEQVRKDLQKPAEPVDQSEDPDANEQNL